MNADNCGIDKLTPTTQAPSIDPRTVNYTKFGNVHTHSAGAVLCVLDFADDFCFFVRRGFEW